MIRFCRFLKFFEIFTRSSQLQSKNLQGLQLDLKKSLLKLHKLKLEEKVGNVIIHGIVETHHEFKF